MTYTFKLSRRLARFRDAAVIAASLFTLSCTDGPSGPGSTPPATDPTSVVIAPDSVSVGPNQTVQFAAATDTSAAVSFNLTSGKGRGRRKVVSLALSPLSSTVIPGTSENFRATATLSDGSIVQPSLTWTATGGTVDPSGKYTAGTVTGKYRVVATASNGVADTAAVSITTIAPILAQIVLSPASISLPAGGSQQFTAEGKSADSATVSVTPTYTATGGAISPAGVYTAGQTPGTFRVIATDPATGVADTSGVTITALGVTLQSVVLIPATASVAQGAKQQFSASGRMSDGSTVPISPSFAATGGSISSSGEYTAGSTAGTYRVIATDQASGNADTSSVTIIASPATLQAVVLTPSTISLTTGGTQQFSASGRMSDGSTSSVTVTWSASGGTISSAGFYTAGTTAGAFQVIATQQGGTKADTSSVTITTPVSSSGSCARAVNVSTASGLSSAINNALAGDCINLAAGTYSGAYTITRSGTQANPITLTGPRTALVGYGSAGDGIVVNASYWILNGFRVSQPTNGGVVLHGSYNVVDSLEIDHTGTSGIGVMVTLCSSTAASGFVTGNEIRKSYIHDTGYWHATYGEGIYNGCSYNNQRVYKTYVHHNTFARIGMGPQDFGSPSEAFEAKGLADSSHVEFNTMAGAIVLRSSENQVNDNTLTGGTQSVCNTNMLICNDGAGIVARNNVFHRNTASQSPSMFFVNGTWTSGTKIYCDNVAVAPTAMGTTCTQ